MTLDAADTQAATGLSAEVLEILPALLAHSVAHYGRPTDETHGVGLVHAKARAILAEAARA